MIATLHSIADHSAAPTLSSRLNQYRGKYSISRYVWAVHTGWITGVRNSKETFETEDTGDHNAEDQIVSKKGNKMSSNLVKLTIHQEQRHPSRQPSAFWEAEAISRRAWDKSKSKDRSEYEWRSWRTTRPSYQNKNLALKGPKIWREVHNSPRH